MKKTHVITFIIAIAIMLSVSTEITALAATDIFSPMGAGRAPTIPILPPVG